MIRNQRPSSNDRDRNVYLAIFTDEAKAKHYPSNARVWRTFSFKTRARKKEETRSHVLILVESVGRK